MLVKRVSAKEARNGFSDLLGSVYYSKEVIIIEKRGRPFAVIINPDEYDKLMQERDERLAVFDEIRARNPEVTAEESEVDAAREIAALRAEQ